MLSDDIEREYRAGVAKRSVVRLFERNGVQLQELLTLITEMSKDAEHVSPQGEAPPCRDDADRIYLHCALAAGVDYLVTRDHDMLDLGTVGTVPIVLPGDLIAAVSATGLELAP